MQQNTLKFAKEAYEAICNLLEGTSELSKIKPEYGSDGDEMLSYYDSELVKYVEPFKYISSDCKVEGVLHEDSDKYVCDDHNLRDGEMIEVYDDDDEFASQTYEMTMMLADFKRQYR